MNYSLRTLPIIVLLTLTSHFVYGQDDGFQNQLIRIQNIDDKTQALFELDSLKLSKNISPAERFLVLKEIFMSYWALNDFKRAIDASGEALVMAKKHGLYREIATTQKFIGIFHYYLGQNNAALAAYEKSLDQFRLLELPIEQANLYNNISLVYTTTGEIAKALSAIQLAEPLYQTYGTEMDKVDIRYTLAVLHLRLKRYDIAIEMLLEVIAKRIEMNDNSGLASAYADIGVAYKNARRLIEAQAYMNKAMDYYLGKKDFYQVASQYQNIADLLILKGEYQQAEAYTLKAIEISQEVGHQKAYIASLYDLGVILLNRGEVELAYEKISLSIKLGAEISYKPSVINNKAILALIYAAKSEPQTALKYHQEYLYEKNQLNSVNLDQQLAQFEAKQLAQQVSALEQSEKLNELEKNQQEQKFRYGILITFATVLLTFLLYRRQKYKQLKIALEAQVKHRTAELEVANKKLSALSFLDSLTSANNRRSFDLDIAAAWERYIQKGTTFILLVASIDEFKLFNEQYGYLAGDEALKCVADTLQAQTRAEDKVYRISGSDFAIIFDRDDIDGVSDQFTKIQGELAKIDIEHVDNIDKMLTLSAGVCHCKDGVYSAEQIIDKVDQRRYIAKKSGRNQLVNQVHKTL